ncbi:MAG: hypothetical protein M1819_005405 [Sarea resinae]|nr:MAG: hypothetical protein M1819_005405 [Sarea resinae]
MATITTTTSASPQKPPLTLKESLARDGYIILPSFLSPSDLDHLRTATSTLTTVARAGNWPHIRTVPKQFPPWPSTPGKDGIWGIQHLLHPSLPLPAEQRTALAHSYFDDRLMGVVKELLDAHDDDLVLELYNLLVDPERAFELRWHRDDIPASATPAEEEERLHQHAYHAQWNLALYDDTSLLVVPGSHRRARTEAERAADPFAPALPNMKAVHMRPGDVVFYDNNILHRGVYRPASGQGEDGKRATLHGSVGLIQGGGHRARNVLQHGVGTWVRECAFAGLEAEERKRAEGMRTRLVELGEAKGDVGFFAETE